MPDPIRMRALHPPRPAVREGVRQSAQEAAAVRTLAALRAMPPPSVRACTWPMWAHEDEPGRRPRFCEAPTEPGRPYCQQHAAKAYRSG